MKILHIVDQISQKLHGGSAKVPFCLAAEQAKLGHEVTIFSTDYQAADQEAPEGVELVKFHCVLNFLGGVRVAPDMSRADFSWFDIMHLHNYRTLVNLQAIGKGVPYVLQAHGSASPIKGLTKPVHDKVWGRIIKGASRCIADASGEVDQYITEGANASRIITIPAGIDINEFKDMRDKAPVFKTVLFLGRMHYLKGADLLLDALSMPALDCMDDLVLQVCSLPYGYDREFNRLLKECGEDRVRFVEPVYGDDKSLLLSRADVVVMPSRYETFGLVALEALACGTPVIVTDRCGIADMLPSYCGRMVPFDAAYLAQHITEVIRDTHADVFRDKRREWAAQFDWGKVNQQIMEVYQGVLDAEI